MFIFQKVKALALMALLATSSAHTNPWSHLYFTLAPIVGTYQYFRSEATIKQNGTSLTHEKIRAFIDKECAHIIDTPIEIYIYDAKEMLGALLASTPAFALHNIVVIAPYYYKILEEIFAKDEWSETDLATLDILRFVIQHESSHIKHRDARNRVIYAAIGALGCAALLEVSKKLYSFPYSELLTTIGLVSINSVAQIMLNKNQERAADHNVQTQQGITGGMLYMYNAINAAKTNEEMALINKMALTHPTFEERLENLQARVQTA